MNKFLTRSVLVLLVLASGWLVTQAGLTAENPVPLAELTPQPGKDSVEAVEQAILEALAVRQGEALVYSLFATQIERVQISSDGLYASAWMQLVDPDSGQVIPSEPGLALLLFANQTWNTALPGDETWELWLQDAPTDIISADEKAFWQEINAYSLAELPQAPISGYRLPWEGGKTGKLSGSVSHDAYIPSGNSHFAYDFYMPGTSSSIVFNLYAARSGTVWMFHDSQPDHDEASPGNYLVLKDSSTSPITYQLYLHLSQNSIPSELRSIGGLVVRGQFIGVADDTGASTGNHLHFQVHTNATSYWGRAVDITFDDVAINGGRPRVKDIFYDDSKYCIWPEDVCVSFQSAYVSGNSKIDTNPPTGGLTGLANDDLVQAGALVIGGWAQDAESGLRRVQVIAAFGGSMHDIGPEFSTSPFAFTWDMCLDNVPDGPISLGLRIFDMQSNLTFLPALATINKSYRCTPPPNLTDFTPPSVQLQIADQALVGGQPILIKAQAADGDSGIERVTFFWHSPDWTDPVWFNIGTGVFVSGLWQVTFNPTSQLEGAGGAFYALAYDLSGNARGDGAWNIVLDRTPPVSSVLTLPPQPTSNAFQLHWIGQDNISGVSTYNLQKNVDVSTWENAFANIPSSNHSIWFTGQPSSIYAFRIRGIDLAGNVESYPGAEDTVTFISAPSTLCNSPDLYENDNQANQAAWFEMDSAPRWMNFCNPLDGGYANDQDWARIPVLTGSPVTLMVFPQIGSAALPQLTLFTGLPDQLIQVAQVAAANYGNPVWIAYVPTASGEVYLRVQSTDGQIIGTGTEYRLIVNSGYPGLIWLPVIFR